GAVRPNGNGSNGPLSGGGAPGLPHRLQRTYATRTGASGGGGVDGRFAARQARASAVAGRRWRVIVNGGAELHEHRATLGTDGRPRRALVVGANEQQLIGTVPPLQAKDEPSADYGIAVVSVASLRVDPEALVVLVELERAALQQECE